jgi:hypothetical protein
MKKSFKTYRPTEQHTLEVNDQTFRLKGAIPGDVLLDFMAGADADNPAQMAKLVRELIDTAIVEEDLERWHAFIRDEANSVDLNTLSEIAGYVAEVMSGNPQKAPVRSGPG